jgi:hypothetical protein
MSKLQALQFLWPPVACAIFFSLFDWIASFHSPSVNFAACMIFIYVVFLPALIEVLWPKKRGAA